MVIDTQRVKKVFVMFKHVLLAGGPVAPPPDIARTSAVFVFERDAPVTRLKSGETWTAGSTPDVKLVTENTGEILDFLLAYGFGVVFQYLRSPISRSFKTASMRGSAPACRNSGS